MKVEHLEQEMTSQSLCYGPRKADFYIPGKAEDSLVEEQVKQWHAGKCAKAGSWNGWNMPPLQLPCWGELQTVPWGLKAVLCTPEPSRWQGPRLLVWICSHLGPVPCPLVLCSAQGSPPGAVNSAGGGLVPMTYILPLLRPQVPSVKPNTPPITHPDT